MSYDSVILTLIFFADDIMLYIAWKMLSNKRRTNVKRLVTRTLKRLGVKVSI